MPTLRRFRFPACTPPRHRAPPPAGPRSPARWEARVAAGVLLGGLLACTPTYNWREVRPAGPMLALLPCKPDLRTRSVPLLGASVPMTVAACEAGGLFWGLAVADVRDAAQAGAALSGLERALAANLSGTVQAEGPVKLSGQTPWPQARQARITGRDPEGRTVWAQSWVYARGNWVAQASVLGHTPPTPAQRDALQAFVAGLRIAP